MDIFSSFQSYFIDLVFLIIIYFVMFFTGYVLLSFFLKDKHHDFYSEVLSYVLVCFLGLFFYIKISFLLGILDIFYLEIILAVSGFFFFVFLYKYKRVKVSLNFGHYLVFILFLILGSRSGFLLVGADDLSYHLPYARAFVEYHAIVVQEHLIYPLHTLDLNIFYSILLMLDDEIFLRLANISFILLLGLSIYDYFQSKVNYWFALVGPLILFSSVRIMDYSITIYVDFGYAFFVTIAFFSYLKWKDYQGSVISLLYLCICALAVSAAASTKYFGLVCGFIIFLFIMIYSSKKIKDALIFLTLCAFFGTHWYIRNFLISGNPVHPFLSDFFGYYLWNENDLLLNLSELKSHGEPESIRDYFREMYRKAGGIIYGVYISFIVSVVVALFGRANFITRLNLDLSGFCIILSIFWYFSAHVDRYLLPAVGMACMSVSILFYLIVTKIFNIEKKIYYFIIPLSVVVSFSLYKNSEIFIGYPVDKHEEILAHRISGYTLLKYANDLNLPEKRVYQVGFADKAYHYEGVAAGHWMGAARWSDVADTRGWGLKLKPAKEIASYLKSHNYYALIISNVAEFDKEALRAEFDIVFEDQYGLVALIKD